jgi:hypothetical protein
VGVAVDLVGMTQWIVGPGYDVDSCELRELTSGVLLLSFVDSVAGCRLCIASHLANRRELSSPSLQRLVLSSWCVAE